MRSLQRSEEQDQKMLFEQLGLLQTIWPKLALAFHIPNSGAGPLRGMAGRMRGMGVKAGVPDIFYPVARQGYHGFWIELKSLKPGARVSPEQTAWLNCLVAEGYRALVCRGYQQALEQIVSYETGLIYSAVEIVRLPVICAVYGRKHIDTLFSNRRRVVLSGQKQMELFKK